jgi:hypothetical protein
MTEYVVIQGKQISYERANIPVSECELDPRNPRIQYLVGQRAGQLTETELEDFLWQKDAVKALSLSIKQNGGVYDSVIVQRIGNKFRVREGNSRTVACRKLLAQFPSDTRFSTMPAMIFDIDLTEEDLAVLLADMHVAGKIRWDAYEQAKHVSDLVNIYGKTYDWLSDHLRLSKSKIVELLSAYQATTDYLKIEPSPDNVRKYSFFQELMRKKELRDQFKEDQNFRLKFYTWLTTGKITDSRQLRYLPMILSNADAAKALDTVGIVEANLILQRNDPSLESDLFAAIKNATDLLKVTPASDIQDLRSGHPQKTIMLRNLSRAIEDLATLAQVKL